MMNDLTRKLGCREELLGNRFVASAMGQQVTFWENQGVMDIFRASDLDPEGAVDCLKRLIDRKRDLVDVRSPTFVRDNVGACLLHWAVIHRGVFKNIRASAIVDYLLAEYPHRAELMNCCYSDPSLPVGLFDGESALHLAVAFDDCELMEILIDAGADPTTRAYGTFFNPSSTCYFGEYPLSFAVACGNKKMAQLLLTRVRNKAKIEGRNPNTILSRIDTFGNTALHIAVIHRRPELFDWILDQMDILYKDEELNGEMYGRSAEEDNIVILDRKAAFEAKGSSGLTPVGLAAVLSHQDNGETFDFVLNRMSRIEWKFGRVSCTSVPLEQLDTIPVSGKTAQISILNLICCRRIYALSIHPHLVGVMEAKWHQFAAMAFFSAFVIHLLRLFAITYHAIEYRHYIDELLKGNKDPDDSDLLTLVWIVFADSALQCFVVILDCYAGYAEAVSQAGLRGAQGTIPPWLAGRKHGEDIFNSIVNTDNFMQSKEHGTSWLTSLVPLSEYDFFAWIGQVLTIIHVVTFLAQDMKPTSFTTGILAVAELFVWMSTLKFTAFSRVLGMLTTIVFRTVRTDVTAFLVVFSIFLIGFGTALHILAVAPNTYTQSLDQLVKTALGDTSSFPTWTQTGEADLVWLSYLLALLAAICGLVILLNLLISIFSCTFSEIRSLSEKEWRLSKGRATILYERRLKLLFPCLLPVLRVNHFKTNTKSDEQLHRYVFMVEESDDTTEEDRIMKAVKRAMADLKEREHKKEELGLEEITFNNMKMTGGGDVPLPVEVGQYGISMNDIEVGSGGLLSAVSATEADQHLNGTNNGVLQRRLSHYGMNGFRQVRKHSTENPLSCFSLPVPTVQLEEAEIGLSFSTPSPAATGTGLAAVQITFDNTCGEGTWSSFASWVTQSLGSLEILKTHTKDSLVAMVHRFLPSNTPSYKVEICIQSLLTWVASDA
eukprot:TRINITY_DN1311_c1_g1_i1.p1 TRINITY_DN1311_c1_g1~~TRINITY_DN1311_c1_g1_i1.p1  ORF type:complete len:964 (+),score=117.49 TRINITY_DN1311_c1_g1_i1:63-2894(+)